MVAAGEVLQSSAPGTIKSDMELISLPEEDVLSRLKTTKEGLSPSEAKRRLQQYGLNELEKRKKKNYLLSYVKQYTQFFAVLLEVAAGLSFFAHQFSPGEGYAILGYAILGAVIINATFAFWQEYKADKTMEALSNLMPTIVKVRRGDTVEKTDARTIVPGDILLIEEGDKIPADAILIEANSLHINIAVLTGESLPVRRTPDPSSKVSDVKDANNVVFAGTTAVSGNGVAVVYATGSKTEFGKIAEMTQEVKKRITPMQREVIRITRILTIAALLVGGVFFLLGVLSGQGFFIAAIFALSLIVANVPEGMLPTITLSLSIASQNMARRNALIKNLDSVQTLGSATVICTDKTGTLTRNEMTAKKIYLSGGEEVFITGEGYFQKGEFTLDQPSEDSWNRLLFFLAAGKLNCRAEIKEDSVIGDPTELGILAAVNKAKIQDIDYTKVSEIPFTCDRKMMSTVGEKGGTRYVFSKGAVEVIIKKTNRYMGKGEEIKPFGEEEKQAFLNRAEEYEKGAFRVLALAFREGEKEEDLIMLGLVAMMDLPRVEVPDAIEKCQKAGIRVLILTGDNPHTAEAIARQVGLTVDQTITSSEMKRYSDEDLSNLLATKEVLFARVGSEQKLRIARLLQAQGEVVAMTGDGVNDAPALRKADIGIAMGQKGTEVAKEAADMVLIDDNFASIVAAIEEGRTVYFNIKKFVTYILSSNVPEIVPYVLQFFLRIPLPLSVIQILTIDLGSDMLPGLALGNERPEKGIMERPPVGEHERILDREVFKRGYFFLGAIEGTAAMAAFLGFLFLNGWMYGDLSITNTTFHIQAMTMTLLAAISCQLMNVWTLRSWEFSAFSRGLFTNRLLIIAIILELAWIWTLLNVGVVQTIFNTAPVPPQNLLLLVPFPLLLFFSHELYKYRIRARKEESSKT